MISTAEFKKQISKSLSVQMKALGFKGSGFHYLMSTDDFVFAIGLQADRYGGQCCLEFGIQPKAIEDLCTHKIDFKKIRYYECEFRKRLAFYGKSDQWWEYSDDERKNNQTAADILSLIKSEALPVINLFKINPNILDGIEVTDFGNIYKKIPGMPLDITDIRFAWVMTKISTKKNNIEKAKQFAKFGLSKLGSSSQSFCKPYFEEVLKIDN